MRLVPRRWSNELWVCSIRGHVTPAASALRLGPGDDALGRDLDTDTRLVRCLRCDDWTEVAVPPAGTEGYDVVPSLDQLDLPRRGQALEDAIVLRLIAIERGIHGVLFTVLAVALLFVRLDLGRIRTWAATLRTDLTGAIDNTGTSGHTRLARELASLSHLQKNTIDVLLVTAVLYAVVESTEAVGLWHEKRWAEYLTVVATAGFLPFEILEAHRPGHGAATDRPDRQPGHPRLPPVGQAPLRAAGGGAATHGAIRGLGGHRPEGSDGGRRAGRP